MRDAMWMMHLVATFAFTACFYDPDLSRIPDDEDVDTGTGTGTGAAPGDAGDSDTGGSGGEPSGLGAACTGEEACAGYDADYCLMDPTNTATPGICTVRGCDTKGCPSAYLCCDCSALQMEIMCVPEAASGTIAAFCPCS